MEAKLLREPTEGFKYSKGTILQMKNEGLVARIDTINSLSFRESVNNLKNFSLYQTKYCVDVVIAELDPFLAKRIKSVIQKKGYNFDFQDFGHLCLLFDYIYREVKINPHYTTMQDFQEVLKNIKKEMKSKRQHSLYQICAEKNKNSIEKILESEGFRIR